MDLLGACQRERKGLIITLGWLVEERPSPLAINRHLSHRDGLRGGFLLCFTVTKITLSLKVNLWTYEHMNLSQE